jgi:hypothetical protein
MRCIELSVLHTHYDLYVYRYSTGQDFVHLCICKQTYTYTYIYICIYVYITYICIYIYINICIYFYITSTFASTVHLHLHIHKSASFPYEAGNNVRNTVRRQFFRSRHYKPPITYKNVCVLEMGRHSCTAGTACCC